MVMEKIFFPLFLSQDVLKFHPVNVASENKELIIFVAPVASDFPWTREIQFTDIRVSCNWLVGSAVSREVKILLVCVSCLRSADQTFYLIKGRSEINALNANADIYRKKNGKSIFLSPGREIADPGEVHRAVFYYHRICRDRSGYMYPVSRIDT